MIEDSLKELRYFMNQVEGYYSDSETGYEYFVMTGDGDFLIEVLKRGLRYIELWKDKKIDFMDMQNSKYNDA